MYKILLVDDEYLELEMLENYVPWGDMGFEVIATARNGHDALAKTMELHPDIIITDIKMPFMDGLEFSKHVHKSFPEIKIIFLSGYNQFEYLKSALQVEAIDYLLKPIEMSELQLLMSSVRKKCDTEEQIRNLNEKVTPEYIKDVLLIEGNEEWHKSADNIRSLCNNYLGSPSENSHFNIILVTIDEYRFLSEYKESNNDDIISIIRNSIQTLATNLKAILFSIEEYKYVIITFQCINELIKSWKAAHPQLQKWVTICLNNKAIEINELPGVYQNLNQLRNWHVKHYGPGQVIEFDENRINNSEITANKDKPDISLLIKFIQQSNYEDAAKWINSFYSSQSEKIFRDGMYSITFDLIDMIYEVLIIPNGALKKRFEDRSMLYKQLLTIESLSLLETIVNKLIQRLIFELKSTYCDPYQLMVLHINEFIEENYSEPLTIESLAKKFYFSPNYLRFIFKKYTGITLLEQITNVRMQHAVHLLQETSLKVHEISSKIGYINPSYFCAIFREKFGVTPNEYRNRLGVK